MYRLDSSNEEVYYLQKIVIPFYIYFDLFVDILMISLSYLLCILIPYLNLYFIMIFLSCYMVMVISNGYELLLSFMYVLYSNILDIQPPSVDTYILWVACDKNYHRNF